MDSEDKIVIAFIFKRSGKSKLKESEIYLPLSLELGWFSTKEARQFIEYAIKQKLLIKKEGLLTPSFDVEKIDIAVGFSPSKSTFTVKERDEEEDVIQKIINRIIEKTDHTYEEIIKEINRIQEEKRIIPQVAVLLLAKEFNLNVEDSLDAVEKRIFIENVE